MGYGPWGHKESDTTERLHFLFFSFLCHVWSAGLTAHPCPSPSPGFVSEEQVFPSVPTVQRGCVS